MTIRLFMLEPDVVFAAQINMANVTYPLDEIQFNNVTTGAFGDIIPEMTLLLGTDVGLDDLGRQRCRKAATSDTIYVGRSSNGIRDGELDVADDAYITVLNDFRVWAKIPFINEDGDIFKDSDLEVSDNTEDLPPVANAGVGTAATISGSTISVSFDATNSFATADGASITGYLWDVDDGTITSGTTTTAAITATFPAGFRWVTLTVTDSNAKTHTCRVPVYARSAAADTTINYFNIVGHRITPQGQQLNIRILDTIPVTTYPDGTLVMLWEDEPASSLDRSHMLFIGWHQTDPTSMLSGRTGTLRDTVIECLDVAGRLDRLPGFTQSVEIDGSPSTWTEMTAPNMDKYLHYLLHWHSTALDLADWTWTGTGSSFPFVILGSDGESLFDQVERRAAALVPDYHLTCNRLGQLQTVVDPMLQNTGDRTATVQDTINDEDIRNLSYTHQRPPTVHWLRGDAIKTSSTNIKALFCIAPGATPGQGEIESQSNEQLAQNQLDLNETEGHRYARLNAPETLFNIMLSSSDDLDIEPADLTWLNLNYSGAITPQRGQTFTNARGLVQEMNITYENGRGGLVKTVELLWERETDGPPATTYVQPEDDIPPVEYPPPPPPVYDPYPGETPGDGFGTAYAFLSNKLAQTSDLSVASPVWTDISGGSGTKHDWILDPWNPATRGFCLTSTGVWRVTGLDSSPSWTQVLASGDVPVNGGSFTQFAYKIQGSINVEDYFVTFATMDDSGGDELLKCCYTEDAGDTWSFATVTTNVGFGTRTCRVDGGFDIVPHLVSGDIRIYAAVGKGAADVYQIFRSNNRGASWSNIKTLVYSGDPDGGTCFNTPYKNNQDGLVGWCSYNVDSGGSHQIYKTTDGWSTYTQISLPGAGTNAYETWVKRLGIEIYIQDQNRVSIWNSQNRLYASSDGLNFSEITYSGYNAATHGSVSGAGGFPTALGQYYIITSKRYVFVSTDGGYTWINKTGDLQTTITADETVTQTQRGVIVPLWIAE